MFAPTVSFVDVETTGGDPTRDRITEVGIVRVVEGRLDHEWSALVNPGRPIPPAIQRFTGITDEMVSGAPSFAELAGQLMERLGGDLFVAHNARFDLGFLRAEFGRLEMPFRPQVLCTVKLSRALYPGEHRHGLDAVIARHGIVCTERHRALGDARVLWEFAQRVAAEHTPDVIGAALTRAMRPPSLPAGVDAEMVDALPDGSGVFVLWGDGDLPLYVGSGGNLRSAVLTHLGGRGARYAAQVRRVEIEPAGELAAQLLAARRLRELHPLHNRRHAAEDAVVLVRSERGGAVALELASWNALDEVSAGCYGPFTDQCEALRRLRSLAEAHGLCLARCGVEPVTGICSARRGGQCLGVCEGAEATAAHDARLEAALARYTLPVWPFDGPVAVREKRADTGRETLLVFDRWCWLGAAEDQAELEALLGGRRARRDENVFRILRRYLSRPEGAHLRRLAPSVLHLAASSATGWKARDM